MVSEKLINEMYGEKYTIEKLFETKINFKKINKGQCVVFGDGFTYVWLLTFKKERKV